MSGLLGLIGLGGVGRGGWIAVALLIALASAGSAWVSWSVCDGGWQSAYAKDLEDAYAQAKADADDQWKADRKLMKQELARQQEVSRDEKVVYREIYREKPGDGCADRPIPASDERVLNQARTGGLHSAEAAAGTTGAAEAPPTNREERAAHAQCGIAYRRIASRYQGLIDWVNRELVKTDDGGGQ